MNKRIIKKITAITLMLVMTLSTATVSLATVSAANDNITYNLSFKTAGSNGSSINDIIIVVHGTNGSTRKHNLGVVGYSSTDTASFEDVNVGTITGVTVETDDRITLTTAKDGWYPESITVNDTTIYGGRWVDEEKPVTLMTTDEVYKITIKTGDNNGAGTDSDVKVTLYSANGKTSQCVNASAVHPCVNAFERKDKMSFYMYVGTNFDKANKITFEVPGCGIYAAGISWFLESVSGEKIQGSTYDNFTISPNTWIAGSESWKKTFTI